MSKATQTLDILVVEDDWLLAEHLLGEFREHLHSVRVRCVGTESEFYELLPAIRATPPDLIILDIMLRWADPSEKMPEPPDEARSSGPWRAGLRCYAALQATTETQRTPTIFYSVLERADVSELVHSLPPHVLFLQKRADTSELLTYIRSLVEYLPAPSTERRGFLQRAFAATEAKPEWLGFSIDLKKLFDDPVA